ncbi:MAG: hypothetical protein WD739_06530 [Actinomycetota bacterium]
MALIVAIAASAFVWTAFRTSATQIDLPPVDDPSHAEEPPPPPVQLEPRITEKIEVGSFPSGVALWNGAVWVTTQGPEGLSQDQWGVVKIDAQTNEVIASIPVADAVDVTAGAGSVWIAAYDGQQGVIRRIDPATNEVVATIRLGGGPSGVDFGLGALWVTTSQTGPPTGAVLRIDPTTDQVVGEISIDEGSPRDIAIGEGSVWVSGPSKVTGDTFLASSLWQIDPQSDRLVRTVVDQTGALSETVYGPDSVSAGEGSVWAADHHRNLVQIDPMTGEATPIPLEGGVSNPFLVYGGNVWFVSDRNGRIGRLDTQTLERGSQDLDTSMVIDAALDPTSGTLWIANYRNTVTRIELASG